MKIRDNKCGFKRRHKPAIAAMALGALMSFQAGAVRADDTATEIRLLKSKLKQLEARVNEQARKQRETQAQVRHASAQPGPGPAPGPSPWLPPTRWVPPPGGNGPVNPPPYSADNLSALEASEAAERGIPVLGPSSFFYKGIAITPGGFLALESVFRTRSETASINSTFANIPYSNNIASHTNEFRFDARQSRMALLMQGDVSPTTHLSGYGEFDFLSSTQTANQNESNSFTPRIRHIYMAIDKDDFGAHFLAGQTWSLATMNTRGIMPRLEDIPLTIDAQYVPGFTWARQPQIRVVKDFDYTFWAALSVENPQTTFFTDGTPAGPFVGGKPTAGAPAPFPTNFAFNSPAAAGGLFNAANTFSLNHVPDIIGKIAWDPTIYDRTIHMEAFGMFRDFYDRFGFDAFNFFPSNPTNHNNDVIGGGVGGSILIPVIPTQLDVQFSGMTGRGIGRYGSGQLADVTFRANGSIAPIPETMLLAGLIWHANPALDVYAYAGGEFEQPQYSFTPGKAGLLAYGYGNPLYTNAGCNLEGSTVCNGNTKSIRQITAGFWDSIYKGPFGRVSGGLQYSFTQRDSFPGFGGAPSANEHMLFTSLRWYPF